MQASARTSLKGILDFGVTLAGLRQGKYTLVQPLAAVCDQHLAVDIVRRGRTEDESDFDYLIDGLEATGRYRIQDLLLRGLARPECGAGLLGIDESRAEAVDLHVSRPPLDSQGLRHRDDACFCRGRMHRPRAAIPCVGRRDAQDLAMPLLQHALTSGQGAVGCAVQHDIDYAVPAIGREVLGAREEVASGIIDENIDAAGFLDHALDGGFDVIRLADVKGADQRFAAFRLDCTGSFLQQVLTSSRKYDACAEFRRPQCEAPAYACACASDEDGACRKASR